MKTNRFERGSGCYECIGCGKKTRETGECESNCGLCRDCFEREGWRNEHSDNDHENTGAVEGCPFCEEAIVEKDEEEYDYELDLEREHFEGHHDEDPDGDCPRCNIEMEEDEETVHDAMRTALLDERIARARERHILIMRAVRDQSEKVGLGTSRDWRRIRLLETAAQLLLRWAMVVSAVRNGEV